MLKDINEYIFDHNDDLRYALPERRLYNFDDSERILNKLGLRIEILYSKSVKYAR